MSEEIMKKLNKHDEQLDLIALAVVNNTQRLDSIDEKLENMATREDINKMFKKQDEILGLLKKNDQEMTFMGQRVKRNESDIKVIKPLVGLSVEA